MGFFDTLKKNLLKETSSKEQDLSNYGPTIFRYGKKGTKLGMEDVIKTKGSSMFNFEGKDGKFFGVSVLYEPKSKNYFYEIIGDQNSQRIKATTKAVLLRSISKKIENLGFKGRDLNGLLKGLSLNGEISTLFDDKEDFDIDVDIEKKKKKRLEKRKERLNNKIDSKDNYPSIKEEWEKKSDTSFLSEQKKEEIPVKLGKETQEKMIDVRIYIKNTLDKLNQESDSTNRYIERMKKNKRALEGFSNLALLKIKNTVGTYFYAYSKKTKEILFRGQLCGAIAKNNLGLGYDVITDATLFFSATPYAAEKITFYDDLKTPRFQGIKYSRIYEKNKIYILSLPESGYKVFYKDTSTMPIKEKIEEIKELVNGDFLIKFKFNDNYVIYNYDLTKKIISHINSNMDIDKIVTDYKGYLDNIPNKSFHQYFSS